MATAGSLGYAVFAWSLNYIDVSVAAILFGSKTILMILCARFLFKKEKRYKKITLEKWGWVILAFIGLIFVIVSQIGAADVNVTTIFVHFTNAFIWLGIGAALLAALLSAFPTPFSLKWSSLVSKSTESIVSHTPTPEFFFVVVAFAIARLIGGFLSSVLGYSVGESISIVTANNLW